MSRWIDADALTKRVEESNKSAGLHLEDLRKIRRWIKNVPSIDIVRCKECKWRNDYGCHNPIWGDGWANYPSPNPREDGFCSYGERNTND